MNTTNQGSVLHERLKLKLSNNQYPTVIAKLDTACYRMQSTNNKDNKPYSEGFYFWAPTSDLGRYNDPNGKLEVCYVATTAPLALAEIFGRRKARDLNDPETFFIGSGDLKTSSVATNHFTKDVTLLDIGGLLSCLGMTTDQISCLDYNITQDIVRFFSELDDCPIDGIAYRSRHHDDSGYCYALWKNSGDSGMLKTDVISTIESFKMVEGLPSWWSEDDIEGEEILTDILGYKVVLH
jgi:hypothetical protein